MGEKAAQKRMYILEQAKKVFAKKGFKNVTMKDIVSACQISRGGVYLYFSDTGEIFEEVLKLRAAHEHDPVREPEAHAHCAREQMRRFLQGQKAELMNPADHLIVATYEYLFAKSESIDRTQIAARFHQSVSRLSALIQYGVDRGEFSAEPATAASTIVLLLEGLRISSTVLAFSEGFLDQQIDTILLQLERGVLR